MRVVLSIWYLIPEAEVQENECVRRMYCHETQS